MEDTLDGFSDRILDGFLDGFSTDFTSYIQIASKSPIAVALQYEETNSLKNKRCETTTEHIW
jgi:hypothetical protein